MVCIYSVRLGENENKLTEVEEMNPINAIELCGICEEKKEAGIHLYKIFICSECERNMIHTEPREEKYQYYLQKLKNINHSRLYS